MGRIAVVLFVVLCFGMAGGVYVLGVQQPTQAFDEAVTVDGTVQSAEVESGTSDTGVRYSPNITYQYRFDGQTYTNDDYVLVGGVSAGTPGTAEEVVDSYSVGQSVTVYVVPDDPSNSFLKRGSVGLFFYGILGFLGFLGVLGVVALVGDLLGAEWVNIK